MAEHVEQVDEATDILLSEDVSGDEPQTGFAGLALKWAVLLTPLAIACSVIGNEVINGCASRVARCQS